MATRDVCRTEKLADLEKHARDFASRAGFTYTVLPADVTDRGAWPFESVDYAARR